MASNEQPASAGTKRTVKVLRRGRPAAPVSLDLEDSLRAPAAFLGAGTRGSSLLGPALSLAQRRLRQVLGLGLDQPEAEPALVQPAPGGRLGPLGRRGQVLVALTGVGEPEGEERPGGQVVAQVPLPGELGTEQVVLRGRGQQLGPLLVARGSRTRRGP